MRWRFHNRADLLAGVTLCGLCALGSWLTWGRLYDPLYDQGWYMQVAARSAAGDVLYRDVIWMYGPLPVYILAGLFRLWGTGMVPFWVLVHSLATLGCLLTYRVARFLLPAPLALLGTAATFLGGWWGGYLSYVLAYTGAVPLGAVLGLLFLFCLLSYLKSEGTAWLLGAGVATGGALLTKPEFALACTGTGLLFLSLTTLFPDGLGRGRSGRAWALGVYLTAALIVVGIGYGPLRYRAGWQQIWQGVSGYDQDRILLRVWPPWGTPRSWGYILSGLGLYGLLALALAGLSAPRLVRTYALLMILAAGLAVGITLLPWGIAFLTNSVPVSAVGSSATGFIQEMMQLIWAPGTLLLSLAIAALGAGWLRAYRHRQPIERPAWYLAVLIVYSLLPPARSFFHPLGTFHFQYLDSLFPALIYAGTVLVPRAMERKWDIRAGRTTLQAFWAALLVFYGAAGLAWDVGFLARFNTELATPRGRALVLSDAGGGQPWDKVLGYILSHTGPGDSIAVLGHAPGFYFLSGQDNPLRQDTILPGMGSSPEDAQEIAQRLAASRPELIIIPQGVKHGRGWFWELDVGRDAYTNLMPVWDYVGEHYQMHVLVGCPETGYAVYIPQP